METQVAFIPVALVDDLVIGGVVFWAFVLFYVLFWRRGRIRRGPYAR